MFFKVILLVLLTRLLIATDKPLLCTGLYLAGAGALGLLSGLPLPALALGLGISGAIYGLYFWLLDRFHSGILYWVILLVGLPVCLLV